MKNITEGLKVPTTTQIAKRLDELVVEAEQQRFDLLRAQLESRAMAELSEELNRDRFDSLVTDHARGAGMTFVRDVWPDHPAAGHVIGVQAGTHQAVRPCGARHPFRLAEDGVWFCDHWVSSPIFPAGRTESGAVVVAFQVEGAWRYGTPTAPQRNHVGDSAFGGFESLRSLGLRMNPAPLRGRPEFAGDESLGFGDGPARNSVVDEGVARSADDLLWRFVNATQNECPWEVPA